jgi:hypothetical protein
VTQFENSFFSALGIDAGFNIDRLIREDFLKFVRLDVMCRYVSLIVPIPVILGAAVHCNYIIPTLYVLLRHFKANYGALGFIERYLLVAAATKAWRATFRDWQSAALLPSRSPFFT